MGRFWTRWAGAWAMALTAFGLLLAGAADPATDAGARWVYGLVGPGHPLQFDATLRFSIALMGAVSIGWGATIIAFALNPDCRGEPAVWRCVTYGFVVWFVIDSTLSIKIGFPLNAVSNSVLAVLGAPALWRLGFAHAPSTNTAIRTAGSVP